MQMTEAAIHMRYTYIHTCIHVCVSLRYIQLPLSCSRWCKRTKCSLIYAQHKQVGFLLTLDSYAYLTITITIQIHIHMSYSNNNCVYKYLIELHITCKSQLGEVAKLKIAIVFGLLNLQKISLAHFESCRQAVAPPLRLLRFGLSHSRSLSRWCVPRCTLKWVSSNIVQKRLQTET